VVNVKHVKKFNYFYIYYMTDIEKNIKLPEPLKVKPSIVKYLDKLEKDEVIIPTFRGE